MKYTIALAVLAAAFLPAAAQGVEIKDLASQTWKLKPAASQWPSAFVGGQQADGPAILCRVRHRADVEAGHIGEHFCMIGGDGMNRRYSEFELLLHIDAADWAAVAQGALPANAIPINGDLGPATYVCRIAYNGEQVLGMVREGKCSAGYETGELIDDAFEVLIDPDQSE